MTTVISLVVLLLILAADVFFLYVTIQKNPEDKAIEDEEQEEYLK